MRAVDAGVPRGEVARRFAVSNAMVGKLLRQRRATGSLAPRPHAGGEPPTPGDGVAASMSRPGNCHDDACVESFFGTPKTQFVHRTRCATRDEARGSEFEWIECWYNRRRQRHCRWAT